VKHVYAVILLATVTAVYVPSVSPGQADGTEPPGADQDWPHARKAQHLDLDARLLNLAGRDATFCGHVALGQQPAAANRCALRAFGKNVAFYVAYDLRSIDSISALGLARDWSGQVHIVEFDSIGFAPDSQRARGEELSDNLHIFSRPCPRPYQLRKDTIRGDILTCFPPPQHGSTTK